MTKEKPSDPYSWFGDAMKLLGIEVLQPLSAEMSLTIHTELQKNPEIVAEAQKILATNCSIGDLMEMIRLEGKQNNWPVHLGHIPTLALAFIDRIRNRKQQQD